MGAFGKLACLAPEHPFADTGVGETFAFPAEMRASFANTAERDGRAGAASVEGCARTAGLTSTARCAPARGSAATADGSTTAASAAAPVTRGARVDAGTLPRLVPTVP